MVLSGPRKRSLKSPSLPGRRCQVEVSLEVRIWGFGVLVLVFGLGFKFRQGLGYI